MAHTIEQAVRDVCLWLPQSEERLSHGSPNFRVGDKTFAMFVINHHGDGRVALWLCAQPGAQEHRVRADPAHFFVPPYVGVRGWLGVILDRGIAWTTVAQLVREAYEKVAPAALKSQLGKTPRFKRPAAKLGPEVLDPFKSAAAQALLKQVRKRVAVLPQTTEGTQFGHPVWKVGSKSFLIARFEGSRLTLCFWVGADQQGLLTADPRYTIPPYIGHNGWIALDARHVDWQELQSLLIASFRHFALKRILRQLDL